MNRTWRRLAPIFESPTLISSLNDVAKMREAMQHDGRHLGVGEDLWPIREGKIGGDDHRHILVKFRDQMEEELGTGIAEGQVAELVDHDQIMAQQGFCHHTAAASRHVLFQAIDEIDEIEERALE
jgi:hypothetical protein